MAANFNSFTLKRLRTQRRVNRPEIAKYLGTSVERVEEFETGKRPPTGRQVELLADLFGVPVYDLFGEADVKIDNDLVDYRTKGLAPAKLSANGLKKIVRAERHAKFTQFLLSELKDNFVPTLPRVHQALSDELAHDLRNRFDEWATRATERETLQGEEEAKFLTWLRIFTELQGSVTAIHDAPEEDYWGFYTDAGIGFPSIFINRTIQSKKSQLFTFCHEMAHYIEDSEGISDPYSLSNSTELRCNRFAAEFVAPADRFRTLVEGFSASIFADTAVLVRTASQRSLLSKQATAIRLHELGYITGADYSRWFNNNKNWYIRDKRTETDNAPIITGIHHAKAIGEIGYLPVYLSYLAVKRRLIDAFDVEAALGLSRALQEKAFSLAKRRIEAVVGHAD